MQTFDEFEHIKSFKAALRHYGFPESGFERKKSSVYVILVLAVTLATWILLGALGRKGSETATAVFALGAFLIAYQQWRAARYEASMDKYYERLDVANRRLEALKGVDSYVMYVFTELDNLEYVIEKYKLGYISSEQAFRGLKTFRAHCRNIAIENMDGKKELFRDLACHLVGIAGYQATTSIVVKNICADFKSPLPPAAEQLIEPDRS
jgi:hypothetical protein